MSESTPLWNIHQFDQMDSGFKDIATTLDRYFAALQAQGFTRQEAFWLVQDFAEMFWERSFEQTGGRGQ